MLAEKTLQEIYEEWLADSSLQTTTTYIDHLSNRLNLPKHVAEKILERCEWRNHE